MFLVLALIAVTGGTLFTYLYDEDAPLVLRVCAGTFVGLCAFGLLGFIYASWLGLTLLALSLSAATVALPALALREPKRRARVLADVEVAVSSARRAVLHPTLRSASLIALYALVSILLWLVYDRAMFEQDGALYTGLSNNYGDLPFHLSVVTSFVKGTNFPPEDPTYAGARFTYPFLADFIAACFVRAGATLRDAMLLENLLMALGLTGLLHRWALLLTRDRAAAHLSPVLVFLSGGLGWWLLFDDARKSDQSILSVLIKPPHDYTIIPETIYRWGNALTTLLVPQRSMLLGMGLALVVFIEWWKVFAGGDVQGAKGAESKAKRGKAKRAKGAESIPVPAFFPFLNFPGASRMIGAGIVAGLLPLAHAHTFIVVVMVGSCLALIDARRGWRAWAAFFIPALLLAGPQMWWATHGSSVQAGTFFARQYGWDRGQTNVLWFWLVNAGLFIPLLAAALLWRGARPLVPKRLLLFYLPFTLCFIVPNLFKLAPWVWDNIKVLFYWYVASVPLVALLLARLWRGGIWRRIIVAVMVVALTLSGALDVWRIISRETALEEFSAEGVAFAAMVEAQTSPRALVLHAPIHNHPVFLTGRRSLMGYPGHIWTHGLDYRQRELEIGRIYAGAPDASALLARYDVQYIVVGPQERAFVHVNDAFFERYSMVVEVGEYRLYKNALP
ncbi:MAG TPA: hypothetical protein VF735_12565 [Pyrinomonadaceae bacterium]|jgi:hypothetical protein